MTKPTTAWQSQQRTWQQISQDIQWDMVVIGGGITGAGVLREAAKRGLKVLLIEQRDFAWGTSSRSSKMVHGGLRYLIQGDFKLTHEAVLERQRMLAEAPGLVEPLKYICAFRKGHLPSKWMFNMALWFYDWFAGRPDYETFDKTKMQLFMPNLLDDGLYGGTQYTDAVTDDARLVMRVLHEAVGDGAHIINYVKAQELKRDASGKVVGVYCQNKLSGQKCVIDAKVVVSATGAWADQLRAQLHAHKRVRPLRGSHLVVPSWRLPIFQALIFQHPVDGRFTFVYPWEGTTVIGTTDLDHHDDLDSEAAISQAELEYMLQGANAQFPQAKLTVKDVLNTWSGVRPIVAKRGVDPLKMKPSSARRDHAVFDDNGLITVTGGKLTTFRVIALDVLKAAQALLPEYRQKVGARVFSAPVPIANAHGLGALTKRRLQGFYGHHAQHIIDSAEAGELAPIAGTNTLWAELRWVAKNEMVEHLDDLMLRRTRLGLLLPEGGSGILARIGEIICPELGWSAERFASECHHYSELWAHNYSLPTPEEAA